MADADDNERSGDVGVEDVEFLGEFRHALDAKGRLILPSEFREHLSRGAYVTKLLDGCLAVFTPQEFRQRTAEMLQLARQGRVERNTFRTFTAASRQVTPDSQGRIPIPASLREFAGLERDVVVVGVFNHVELWSPEKWSAVDAAGSTSLQAGQDSLAGMGF